MADEHILNPAIIGLAKPPGTTPLNTLPFADQPEVSVATPLLSYGQHIGILYRSPPTFQP